MIDGLQVNQAVRFKAGFLVKLGYGDYVINGQNVTLGYGGNTTFVEDVSQVLKVIKEPKKLLKIVDEAGVEYEPEYIRQVRYQYWDDVEEQNLYPDLEAEYEHKKLVQGFDEMTHVYSEEASYTQPIEVTIVGSSEDTGSRFIETPIRYGQLKFQGRGVGFYRLNSGSVALDEYNKIKGEFVNVKWETPSHGHLQFVKADGKYPFGSSATHPFLKGNSLEVMEQLDKAQAREAEIRKVVRDHVMPYVNPKNVSDILTPAMIDKLKSIESAISGIDSKQKTEGSKRSAQKLTRELLETITHLHIGE